LRVGSPRCLHHVCGHVGWRVQELTLGIGAVTAFPGGLSSAVGVILSESGRRKQRKDRLGDTYRVVFKWEQGPMGIVGVYGVEHFSLLTLLLLLEQISFSFQRVEVSFSIKC
jgi:hypothetical protein